MKKPVHSSILILLALLFFISCSKEEVGGELLETRDVGKLSFGSVLGDLGNRNQLIKGSLTDSYEIPVCSEESPLYVRVAIKVKDENNNWSWYKNSNENKIQIEVNPNGTDLDNNGIPDAWFTQESADLELEEGEYSIEYFAVAKAEGTNPEDIIYMAPRIPEGEIDYSETIQYHNFVDKPLPIKVNIRPGVKYYQPIEILCYEEHFAFAFGYLFFDFNTTNLIYLCTYGNVCDDNQKHIPAQFKIKVWKDSNEGDLLVAAQNERKSFTDQNGSHYYADALCFPLPELMEGEAYYAKIWLIENENETLVREGNFDAEDLSDAYQEEQEHYYYHFREACCEAEDNYSLLEDITENEEECEEDPQDPPQEKDCNKCEGKISKLTFQYSGADNTQIRVEQNKTGNNTITIFEEVVNNGAIFTIEGEFSQGNQPNSLWTEIYIYEGNNEVIEIHTSCSDPEVVPGYIIGNFEILSGESANGGLLCPPE